MQTIKLNWHVFILTHKVIKNFARMSVVSWSLSNTMETGFCIDALKKGLVYAHPEIINSKQGCQFTSNDWVDYLSEFL